ncbi:Cytochrome c oxidase subunit 3 [Crateriforma conspicua]|uniref:Cytochrome c oxidase subunit 3 n=1 Tax=Crateriforma conspicua TaxID=2527996 RepID=A0A5C6FN02_9PLAN|nr:MULTISPECIES: cytochrome c oxidase subunit 3 [Crateriforma]TWU61733.1 Cytochrome c oxidase subunit 3 [Crateriforma conspicua]
MSTTDVQTTETGASASASSDSTHGHDHDHPSFLAHHFDTPEQQFDSGKLGMWLFLVTEVLFFSGMFCAYAIFRMLRPEVFEGCSQFLNTKLGAINTGVLLFSSLTMAWAVRCAQTEEYKKLTALLATTLSCAMVFLGVKSIEYSHKWGMGLNPAGLFTYDPANPHPGGHPNYLLWLCIPFIAITIGVAIWLVVSFLKKNTFQFECAKPLLVVCLSFFAGVGLGTILESGESAEHHAAAGDHGDGDAHAEHGDGDHADHAVADHDADVDSAVAAMEDSGDLVALETLAADESNTGLQNQLDARRRQYEVAGSSVVSDVDEVDGTIEKATQNVFTPRTAGVFFSIYYCMTGIHAIHILAGIGVLVWLLVRSIRQDFNRQYFGPVDYVGLYWHLVDLIWIYLFPLLYLIR